MRGDQPIFTSNFIFLLRFNKNLGNKKWNIRFFNQFLHIVSFIWPYFIKRWKITTFKNANAYSTFKFNTVYFYRHKSNLNNLITGIFEFRSVQYLFANDKSRDLPMQIIHSQIVDVLMNDKGRESLFSVIVSDST